jgi:hypothetical protein
MCNSTCGNDTLRNTCEGWGLRTPTNGSCPCNVFQKPPLGFAFMGPCCPAYLVTNCLDGSTDGQVPNEASGDGASMADVTASSVDAPVGEGSAPEGYDARFDSYLDGPTESGE